MFARRMRILQALIQAHEANAEAMRLLMEDEESDRPTIPPSSSGLPPPGMRQPGEPRQHRTVDTLSTNHRDPDFAKRPTHFNPRVTAEHALNEVRKLWANATDPAKLEDARTVGLRLVQVGLIAAADLDDVFHTKPGTVAP